MPNTDQQFLAETQETQKTPEIPPKRKKINLLLASLLAVSLFSFLGFLYYRSQKEVPAPIVKSQASLNRLNTRSSLYFPGISVSEPSNTDSLPESIGSLIIEADENINVEELTYDNNKKGFKIKYSLKSMGLADSTSFLVSLTSSPRGPARSPQAWETLFASRTTTASVIDLENQSYHAKVEQILNNNNIVEVTVTTIER